MLSNRDGACRDYDDKFVTIDHNWNTERDDADDNWDHDWGPNDWDEPEPGADGDHKWEYDWHDGSQGWDADAKWNPTEWDSAWSHRPGSAPSPSAGKPGGGAVDLTKSGNEWGHSTQNLTAKPITPPASEADGPSGSQAWRSNGLNGGGPDGAGGWGGGNATDGGAGGGRRYHGDCGELDETVCGATAQCAWSFFTGCSLRSARRQRNGRVYVERGYPANPVAETVRDIFTGQLPRCPFPALLRFHHLLAIVARLPSTAAAPGHEPRGRPRACVTARGGAGGWRGGAGPAGLLGGYGCGPAGRACPEYPSDGPCGLAEARFSELVIVGFQFEACDSLGCECGTAAKIA